MPTVEIFLTGNQIGTFSGLSSSGNSNGMKVNLQGVQALGGADDVFRIVIRQVNAGDDMFRNGQMVDIYAWPDTTPPGPPLYSSLNPQHDQFQGRASSGTHQIMTSPAQIIIATEGITPGNMQIGPGADPPRGEQLSFSTFPTDPPVFPCFAAGTVIETASGPRQIETLRPGDLIMTADHGPQPLRWIGQRSVPGIGALAPIQISAGSLGNRRDLLVSPQHRMLIKGEIAQALFNTPEVLVAARDLINDRSIMVDRYVQDVTYVHLLLDRHQIVFANGLESESFHPASMPLNHIQPDQQQVLFERVPGLDRDVSVYGDFARRALSRSEAAILFYKDDRTH